MRSFLGGRWRPVVAASAAVLVLLVGLGLHLATPRTHGVQGDWSAKALDGAVVAERALVSGDNTALDLRTGKTVTLGSVSGGTAVVADDRLIIAGPGRIDSARLDATTRWTWRPPAGPPQPRWPLRAAAPWCRSVPPPAPASSSASTPRADRTGSPTGQPDVTRPQGPRRPGARYPESMPWLSRGVAWWSPTR